MKDRIRDIVKVVLMIAVPMICMSLIVHFKEKPDTTVYTPPPEDTVCTPAFMEKPAKEGLMEALEFYGVHHPEIVYAQAVLETGHFRSRHCRDHNNLFGLYDSRNRRYHRFNHWSESVIGYKNWVQNKYKSQEDYYSFLHRIGYAGDPEYINKLRTIVDYGRKPGKRESPEKDVGAGGGQLDAGAGHWSGQVKTGSGKDKEHL